MTEKVNIREEIGLPKGFYWTPVLEALAKLKSCIVIYYYLELVHY